jgi:hypothetical protein
MDSVNANANIEAIVQEIGTASCTAFNANTNFRCVARYLILFSSEKNYEILFINNS